MMWKERQGMGEAAELAAPGLQGALDDLLARGDEAWPPFLEAATPLILRFIGQRAKGREPDLVMDAYVLVSRKLSRDDFAALRRFRGDAAVRTWLWTVCQSAFAQALRERLGRRRLTRAILRLSPLHQRVFRLRFWDLLSLSEIASMLGEDVGAVQQIEAELIAATRVPRDLVSCLAQNQEVVSLDVSTPRDPRVCYGETIADEDAPNPEEPVLLEEIREAVQAGLDAIEDDTDYLLVVETVLGDASVRSLRQITGLGKNGLYARRARALKTVREVVRERGVAC